MTKGIMNLYSYLFELCWNDHLLNYFSLMHSCGINNKSIVFNIFSCIILTIYCKILIITVKSNVTTNELTVYAKLHWNVKITLKNFTNFSSSCFIAKNGHIKTVSLHTVVFNENVSWYFWDNIHLLKHYPVKLPQNSFESLNYTNQTRIQISISKLSFTLSKSKN